MFATGFEFDIVGSHYIFVQYTRDENDTPLRANALEDLNSYYVLAIPIHRCNHGECYCLVTH